MLDFGYILVVFMSFIG